MDKPIKHENQYTHLEIIDSTIITPPDPKSMMIDHLGLGFGLSAGPGNARQTLTAKPVYSLASQSPADSSIKIVDELSSVTILPNTNRIVESFFHRWTINSEAQLNILSLLCKVNEDVAKEFQLEVIDGLQQLVQQVSQERESAATKADLGCFSNYASGASDSLSVPPRSPNRRRQHSGSELLEADGLCMEFTTEEDPTRENQLIIPSQEVSKSDSGIYLEPDMSVDKVDGNQPQIPLFYFPLGQKAESFPSDESRDIRLAKVSEFFGNQSLSESEFLQVTLMCGICRFLNAAFFRKVCENHGTEKINFKMFKSCWRKLQSYLFSEHALSFFIMTKGENNFLLAADVHVTVSDVVHHHSGLEFLSNLPVFQSRYTDTVITRLFYSKPNNQKAKMTFAEFKKTRFLEILRNLERVEDVNTTLDIFSYQHFYVIYCKFWELDRDHDMLINLQSLVRYDGGSMTLAILSRVASGCGKPLQNGSKSGVMTYEDFIWFILSVEDKTTTQSIEYWFRCLDLDGDGVISIYEIQHFYDDQYDRMLISRMSDLWKFQDFVCSIPKKENCITLSDLKRCKSAFSFFDILFDLRKYDNYVRRIDPWFREMDDVIVENADGTVKRLEGFEKFAAKAYQVLANEETHGTNNSIDSAAECDLNQSDLDRRMDWDDGNEMETEVLSYRI